MSTPPAFPALAGQGWSVHKRPTFSTRVASHVSGREVRSSLYAYTLYEFELTFDALASDLSHPGLGTESLQSLMALYLQCGGQYGTFLYSDPTDNAATGQVIGRGDGATTSFVFQRALGGFLEPVSWVVAASRVYLNDQPQTSGWAIAAPNSLTFSNVPASGTIISADFSYAFLCRFLDDQEDFENFMTALWKVDSLKFRSVKP